MMDRESSSSTLDVILVLLALGGAPAGAAEKADSGPAAAPAGAGAEPAPADAMNDKDRAYVESALAGVKDLSEVSLDELLNAETTVATRSTARTVRESPAIVTMVTREEIERGGYRDLVDVLQHVPGFQFGTDTYSSIYPSVRGVWGAEGKVLVLLDGHELEELYYLTTQFGNRVSLDWVDRIEIIRGPGSVIYGGAAELAVINIVTRKAPGFTGWSATVDGGQMLHGMAADDQSAGDTFARRNLSASWGYGGKGEGDLALTVHGFVGQGNRGDRPYTDAAGDRYNLAGQARSDPAMLSVDASWHGLTLRWLLEDYRITQRDGFGENLGQALPTSFPASSAELSWAIKLSDTLTLTPHVRHVWQRPWASQDSRTLDYEALYTDTTVQRALAGVTLAWKPVPFGDLLAGVDYNYDWGDDASTVTSPVGERPATFARTSFHYSNLAAYAQALADTWLASFSVGARFEENSEFGSSFVPRASITRAFGPAHVKLLASQAFRVPSFANLALNPEVKPEKTTVFEVEAGVKVGDSLYLVANGFDITVDRPIVYFFDDATQTEQYLNYEQTGTRGAELEVRWRSGRSFVNAGYALYTPAGKNKVESYAVPGHSDALLGFAPHTVEASAGTGIGRDLSLVASATWLSGHRYAYAYGAAGLALEDTGAELVANLVLRYENLFARGVTVSLGAYNLFDTRVVYVQPYDNGHTPLPGGSREIALKLAYEQRD